VARAYCAMPGANAPGCSVIADCGRNQDCDEQPFLNNRDGSDRVNQFRAEALPVFRENAVTACSALPQSGENPFIKDQIVLIGDAERSDLHETPYGPKNGVAIMAHATQSDLFGNRISEQRGISVYLLHFLSVLIVIAVNSIRRPLLALGLNVAGLPLLAMAFSYLAFRSWHHWFDFVPILGGVILHQLYEQANENKKLRAEMSDLLGES
jgi:CHASE2 domain-containing sensor protein